MGRPLVALEPAIWRLPQPCARDSPAVPRMLSPLSPLRRSSLRPYRLGRAPFPDSHPLTPKLQRAFGDHTFFLNPDGLTIVEPSPVDRQVGEVVKLAGWADGAHTKLEPDVPEPMPVAIQLES